jgi:hypothetical protein
MVRLGCRRRAHRWPRQERPSRLIRDLGEIEDTGNLQRHVGADGGIACGDAEELTGFRALAQWFTPAPGSPGNGSAAMAIEDPSAGGNPVKLTLDSAKALFRECIRTLARAGFLLAAARRRKGEKRRP